MYYKILDLPPLPDEYIKVALERAEIYCNASTDERKQMRANLLHDPNRPVIPIMKNGKDMYARALPRLDLTDLLKDWVDQNISKEYTQLHLSLNLDISPEPGKVKSDSLIAHTDQTRSYVLLYLIDISNLDQDTVYYQEIGQTLHRKRNTIIEDYQKVKEVYRARYPLHQWVFMDATIIHDVENVQKNRTAIQIAFDIDPFGVMDWNNTV